MKKTDVITNTTDKVVLAMFDRYNIVIGIDDMDAQGANMMFMIAYSVKFAREDECKRMRKEMRKL